MKLTHCATVTSLQRSQRKSIRDSLKITIRTKSKHTKKKQKQYTKLNTDSVPKKTKKNPNTDSVPKRKKPQYTKLARRRRRLAAHRREIRSQSRRDAAHRREIRSHLAATPLIADRSALLAASASPLAVAVGISGAHQSSP